MVRMEGCRGGKRGANSHNYFSHNYEMKPDITTPGPIRNGLNPTDDGKAYERKRIAVVS